MKQKVNKKLIITLGFILIFLGMLILSLIKIINYLGDNKENREIQKKNSEAITVNPKYEDKYIVDFKALKQQNSDAVAYLKVKGTNIDYVVVKSINNEYYLNHNFNKNENVSGWIFADYHNHFDGRDRNIVIYGHNTRDGSMFGSLKNVFTDEWNNDKDNQKIMLITDKGTHYYQVFSVYTIDVEEYYINTQFNNDSEFEEFVKRLKFRSNYPYAVDVYGYDQILTLSTCSGDGTKRVVLHAKLITN